MPARYWSVDGNSLAGSARKEKKKQNTKLFRKYFTKRILQCLPRNVNFQPRNAYFTLKAWTCAELISTCSLTWVTRAGVVAGDSTSQTSSWVYCSLTWVTSVGVVAGDSTSHTHRQTWTHPHKSTLAWAFHLSAALCTISVCFCA